MSSRTRMTLFRDVTPVLLAVFVLLVVTVPEVCAQTEDALRSNIRKITADASSLATKRLQIRRDMEEAVLFSRQARKWFIDQQKVDEEIRKLESGEQVTFDGRNQQDALSYLYKERNAIKTLKGGVVIQGKRYSSLEQLQAAFVNEGEYALKLSNEYKAYNRQLGQLDEQRDHLAKQLKTRIEEDIKSDTYRLESLETSKKDMQMLVNEKDVFCLGSYALFGSAPFMHKSMVLKIIATRYVAEIRAKGTQYNPQELVDRITAVRDNSDEIKKHMATKAIPEMEQKIAVLKDNLRTKVQQDVEDLSGCWLILITSERIPSINVVAQSDGTYQGYIANVGILEHFSPNEHLFTVKRKSTDSFSGTEFSYTDNGRKVKRDLRITIHRGGDALTYRSDETVQMRQCR